LKISKVGPGETARLRTVKKRAAGFESEATVPKHGFLFRNEGSLTEIVTVKES